MYIVTRKFRDEKDNNHIYNKGDFYPYNFREYDYERINNLSSNENALKEALIRELNEDELKALNLSVCSSNDSDLLIDNKEKENESSNVVEDNNKVEKQNPINNHKNKNK